MSLFGLFETRATIENPSYPLSSTTLLDWMAGPRVDSGIIVTPQSALAYSAVYRCTNLISGVCSSLALNTYQAGTKTTAFSPLLTNPHPDLTPCELWRLAYVHRCLWGNGYIQKIRDNVGRVQQLWPISPDRVQVGKIPPSDLNPSGKIFAVTDDWGKVQPRTSREILHLPGMGYDGVTGVSPIRMAAQGIGLALAAERYGAKLFASGNLLSGILQTEQRLKNEDAERLQARWRQMVGGMDRAHDVAVLDTGAKFQSLTMPNDDAEMLKCVVAETEFSMADGTRKRTDELGVGDWVMSWDGAQLVPGRVSNIFPMPVAPTLQVTTACGRSVTTSPNHPYLASQRRRSRGGRYMGTLDSNATWVKADALKPGDYLRVGLDWNTPDSMDRETAWSLGALIGDGNLRSNNNVGFTTADDEIRDRLARWLGRYGAGLRQVGRPSNYYVTTGGVGRGGSPLRDELRRFGMLGVTGDIKRVPPAVMRGGPTAWAGFVAGYLDTDGTVNVETAPQPQVLWTSISRQLLSDVQHLLAMMGVGGKIQVHDATGGPRVVMGVLCIGKPTWTLAVCGRENVTKLAGLLNVAQPRKAARLRHWAVQPIRSQGAKSDPRWVRVVDVADAGEQATYGVTIEGHHTHVTNGLVTHNSREFQILDVARYYGVPPFLMMLTERSTSWGTALEQQALGWLKFSLLPDWLVPFEQRITKELTPQGIEAKYGTKELTRGDSAARAAWYQVMRSIGAMNNDEIREDEDMPPLPDSQGSDYQQPLNSVVQVPGEGGAGGGANDGSPRGTSAGDTGGGN